MAGYARSNRVTADCDIGLSEDRWTEKVNDR